MKTKKANFVEEHIEKIVLGLAFGVFVAILMKYVVLSPNMVEYEKRRMHPGDIDARISDQARLVQDKLDGPAERKVEYQGKLADFSAKLDGAAVQAESMALLLPMPVRMRLDRRFSLPQVGQVEDAIVEHIRAAAYVPVEPITAENYNTETAYEVNDLDLVTVAGQFDFQSLASGFKACFDGESVKPQWRDPCLAQPVFAAVEMQRQVMLGDGSWAEWEEVPRIQIEPQKALYQVTEDAGMLPAGGVTVQMLKFGEPSIWLTLLQPEAYQIASADEQWLPPSLHKQYAQRHREMESQERREARAAEAAEREEQRQREREERTRTVERPAATRAPSSSPSGGPGNDALMQMLLGGGPSGGGTSPRTTTRPSRSDRRAEAERERTMEKAAPKPAKTITDTDIFDELKKVQLTSSTDLASLNDAITIWAHDDTVEATRTYRYRLRVGVFNPIAGTEQFEPAYASFKDKAILWSEYSEPTEAVSIPSRIYFFPVDVQETAMAADVQVARYAKGYWYSEQFAVKRGDVIGKTAKRKADEAEQDVAELTLPDQIDYGTGAVVVDLVRVNDWTGDRNLYQRSYYDMLYSTDGSKVERIPAKLMYWPEELRTVYNEIRSLEKKERQPFVAWGTKGGSRRGPAIPGRPGMPQAPGRGGSSIDELLIQMMLQGQSGGGGR